MEYKGLTESIEIPTRGKYTKIARQAIADFQTKNARTAKLDIAYSDERELKTLYYALKSLVRRKKIAVKVTTQKDKMTNKREIYLIEETSTSSQQAASVQFL
jgi:hypothetical protein